MKNLRKKAIPYAKLMRLHRPIGIYLVLWPTLWGLIIAAEGLPDIKLLVIFIAGVGLMRSAGCVINDYADRHFDGHVRRTQERPLITGEVSPRNALITFAVLCTGAFLLVLLTNKLTVILSLGAVLLAFCYPFVKRHNHMPQVVLGAAFAWSIPMAFAAQSNHLPEGLWLIYIAVILWTVTYDTFYAMVDREDDLKIGIKSTAILFGDMDRTITAILQALTVFSLALCGKKFALGNYFFASLVVVAALFGYQQWLIRQRQPAACFKAFLNNNWVGVAVLAGLVAHFNYG